MSLVRYPLVKVASDKNKKRATTDINRIIGESVNVNTNTRIKETEEGMRKRSGSQTVYQGNNKGENIGM